MSKKYNNVPYSWTAKQIWQAQITGEKNFDSYSFMGCLNDLQGDSDWREAFNGVEDCTGMPEFMDRLQSHFDLCKSSQNPDGDFHVYQHPSQVKGNGEIDRDVIVGLAKRHIVTLAKAFRNNEEPETADRLLNFPVEWTDEASHFFALDWRTQLDARDGRPAGFHLWTAWDFETNPDYFKKFENEYQGCFKNGTPSILGELMEATYSMANDYALQYYLLQSFMTHGLDVDARYELEWVNKCICFFDENTCFVTKTRDR